MGERSKWVLGEYGPKTIGVGRAGGPAYFLMRANHGDTEHLQKDAERVVRALNLLDEHEGAEDDAA